MTRYKTRKEKFGGTSFDPDSAVGELTSGFHAFARYFILDPHWKFFPKFYGFHVGDASVDAIIHIARVEVQRVCGPHYATVYP